MESEFDDSKSKENFVLPDNHAPDIDTRTNIANLVKKESEDVDSLQPSISGACKVIQKTLNKVKTIPSKSKKRKYSSARKKTTSSKANLSKVQKKTRAKANDVKYTYESESEQDDIKSEDSYLIAHDQYEGDMNFNTQESQNVDINQPSTSGICRVNLRTPKKSKSTSSRSPKRKNTSTSKRTCKSSKANSSRRTRANTNKADGNWESESGQEDSKSEDSYLSAYDQYLEDMIFNAEECQSVDFDQPSTSSKCRKRKNTCTAKKTCKTSKANSVNSCRRTRANANKVDGNWSPPLTRNLRSMGGKKLTVSKRLCNNKGCLSGRGDSSGEECDEQVPNIHLEKENDSDKCSIFGVSKCYCCNNSESPETVQNEFLGFLDLKKTSCSRYGVTDCDCCSETETMNTGVTSIVQVGEDNMTGLPANNLVAIDDDESSNNDEVMNMDHLSESQIRRTIIGEVRSEHLNVQTNNLYRPQKMPLSKQRLIESYLQSIPPDHRDCSKPKSKNMEQGLIHDPVGNCTEQPCDNCILEKPILERKNFEKALNYLVISSLPNDIKCEVVHNPIDLSTNSLEKPTENDAGNTCEAEMCMRNVNVVEHNDGRPLDSVGTEAVDHASIAREDSDIMLYVDSLKLQGEEDVAQDCQKRIDRLREVREKTQQSINSILNEHIRDLRPLEEIEIREDDTLNNSVQIIDFPVEQVSDAGESDHSVEFVCRYELLANASERRDIPSTSRSLSSFQHKKMKKYQRLHHREHYESDAEELPGDNDVPVRNKQGLADCAICLEPLHKANEVSSTICGHVFCTQCIKNVVKTYKRCPICRARLNSKKIHPLFLF